ncbi:hypothetical protein K438DRAFT_1965766 [Mycena galopus ATCC 62051]|nr:hypothetical protein K438DRAFT_1965766 [Mycena galopus ATCC 62051]
MAESSAKQLGLLARTLPPCLPKDDERKVKVEQRPRVSASPKLSLKTKEPSPSSEIAMLKALLKRKKEESQRRDLKILDLEKQNKRLKSKRAADAARIESLEAEVAHLKDRYGVKQDHPQQVHQVMDSEDEEPEDVNSGARPEPADAWSSPLATSPGARSPARPTSERPLSASLSSVPDVIEQSPQSRDTSDLVVQPKVKDEVIDVVIKTEGEPDQFKRVTLIKTEDGNFDIWNVDGFGLGPTCEVPEKYNRGFTRKVISDAFGGGHVSCYHHWDPKPDKPAKVPFLTFNRSWNNALPASPGLHGIGFFGMNTCPASPQPVNFFVGEGTNNWRLIGTYDYLRWGEIAPHHISLLPPTVLNNWVDGTLDSQWGKSWIEDTNKKLNDARKVVFTRDGVLAALKDGRMVIPFTILKCVGYPQDWFEKLLYYEKHPQPPKGKVKSRKRRAPGKTQGSPKKQARVSAEGKGKAKQEPLSDDDSDSERGVEEESDDGDSNYFNGDGARRIAGIPKRTSPRKIQKSHSVEL